jgi:hypothetical protein
MLYGDTREAYPGERVSTRWLDAAAGLAEADGGKHSRRDNYLLLRTR